MNEQYFTSLNGYYVKDKEAIHTYDSVAEMKTDSKIREGSYVKTRGYYNPNDGGNGEYIIRTKTNDDNEDNGSIHFTQNNLVAELIVKDNVNVKLFGAYGDGTHNDSTFIQNAIDYVIDNNCKLFIDSDTYLINTGLIINGNINLESIGTIKTNSDINLFTINSDESIFNFNNLLSDDYKGTAILLSGKNYNNTFNINTIKDFEYGISYIPSTNGVQYNKTNFQLLSNYYNIYFKADNTSWVNQNEFFGGRCEGHYGVYFDEGESQSHNYDGNNFYNVGFEDLYDGIVLSNASLNTFKDFRMLESIENNCITLSNSCINNLFESKETSLALWNKISDSCNVFQRRNIYKMSIQTSDYKLGSEELTILNNLPFIRKYRYNTHTDGNRKYLANENSYNTSSESFRKIELFTISLSSTSTITINLDERYDYLEEDYRDFFVKISDRDGDKNLIIKTSNNTEIFNLSTYTGTTGSYSGIFYFKHITNTGSYKWVVSKIG